MVFIIIFMIITAYNVQCYAIEYARWMDLQHTINKNKCCLIINIHVLQMGDNIIFMIITAYNIQVVKLYVYIFTYMLNYDLLYFRHIY